MRTLEELTKEEKAGLVQEVLDKKQGVMDRDWGEMITDWDLDCSPETLRKAGVGVKLASDAGMTFSEPSCIPNAMDGLVERQKLYDLRREIRQDLRELSRTEMLCEAIQQAVQSLPPIGGNKLLLPLAGEEPECELVLGMGDFHYGARFTVTGLCGEVLNEYSPEVFEKRMADLAAHVKRICQMHSPGRLTIMIVGDMLDGLLRASQISRLEYGVVESAMRLSESMSQWIASMSEALALPIRVYAVSGNHGEIRPLGSKAGQFPEENMERIVMHYLHERFRDHAAISVPDNDCPQTRVVDVCNHRFLLTHGQNVDVVNMARDSVTLYHRPIDVFMVGHLHKEQTFLSGIRRGSNVLVERVPSLCGMDPYAQSKGYGAQPGATAILMEPVYGRRCVYPIHL